MPVVNPYSKFANVTPSDTVELTYKSKIDGANLRPIATRGISIGGSGTLAVKNDAGDNITITGLAVGVIHSIETNLILAAGTTATNITAYF